jgi:hypothetical protein
MKRVAVAGNMGSVGGERIGGVGGGIGRIRGGVEGIRGGVGGKGGERGGLAGVGGGVGGKEGEGGGLGGIGGVVRKGGEGGGLGGIGGGVWGKGGEGAGSIGIGGGVGGKGGERGGVGWVGGGGEGFEVGRRRARDPMNNSRCLLIVTMIGVVGGCAACSLAVEICSKVWRVGTFRRRRKRLCVTSRRWMWALFSVQVWQPYRRADTTKALYRLILVVRVISSDFQNRGVRRVKAYQAELIRRDISASRMLVGGGGEGSSEGEKAGDEAMMLPRYLKLEVWRTRWGVGEELEGMAMGVVEAVWADGWPRDCATVLS